MVASALKWNGNLFGHVKTMMAMYKVTLLRKDWFFGINDVYFDNPRWYRNGSRSCPLALLHVTTESTKREIQHPPTLLLLFLHGQGD
jgi:hypothetical protein